MLGLEEQSGLHVAGVVVPYVRCLLRHTLQGYAILLRQHLNKAL
jgi:hypothetical protein